MTVEDTLRAAMHAHDTEAPTHVPWPAPAARPARRRPTVRFALAVAVVAVLVAGGTWLAVAWPRSAHTSTPATPVTPLSCPAERAPGLRSDDVPSEPTVPDAVERLAPTATPQSAVVCSYAQGEPAGSGGFAGGPLDRSAVLSGDLGPVARALSGLPRLEGTTFICPAYASAHDTEYYLVGLTYEDGIVWISAPGDHCGGASNGYFSTLHNVNMSAAASLAAGQWVDEPAEIGATPSDQHVCPAGDGRPSATAAMVPETPSSLTLCTSARIAQRATSVPTGEVRNLAAMLNALAATPNPDATPCSARGVIYTLVFTYPSGPDVRVSVSDACTPGVENGALEAGVTDDLLALLGHLSE